MVVVVDGVMPIQGDGNTVYKAKDHSRATFRYEYPPTALEVFENGESSRARESRVR